MSGFPLRDGEARWKEHRALRALASAAKATEREQHLAKIAAQEKRIARLKQQNEVEAAKQANRWGRVCLYSLIEA